MKLLGWMNFKLKQKGNEPANDTIIAYKEVKSNGAEVVFHEDPSDELFPGFLAIGTLGYQTSNTDPPTPTFPIPFEGETAITEKELKFINDELERFLEEKENEAAYESSERISLSDKHIETECFINTDGYPLQKYLFGSSVELPEIEAEVKQPKGFIKELFNQRNNVVQEVHAGKDGDEKKQSKKKHAGHFMKKMLQNIQPKSKRDTDGSASSKKKLPQLLKMFKRKVHPVNETSTANLGAKNKKFSSEKELNSRQVSPRGIAYDALTVNREHWIKSDADYLVLEL